MDDGDHCVMYEDGKLVAGKGAGEGGGVAAAQGEAGRAAANGVAAMPPGAIGDVNVIVNLGAAGGPMSQPLAAGAVASVNPAAAMAGMMAGAFAPPSAGSGAGSGAAGLMMTAGRLSVVPTAGALGTAGMVMTAVTGGRVAVPPAAGSNTQKPVTPSNPTPTGSKCGNGVLDAGEKCDFKNTSSAACPTAATCDDNNACTADKLDGTAAACSAVCTHAAIVASTGAKDRCCPKGATAATDSDCMASCGDGAVTGDEKCDTMSSTRPCPNATTCDDKNACTNDVISGTGCQAVCTHTMKPDCPAKTPTTTCGDGMVTGTEKCDPKSDKKCPTTCLDDDPCTDDKLEGSADNCTAYCPHTRKTDCTTKQDSAPSCGDGMVGPGETCDPMSSTKCPTSCPKKDGCAIEKLEGSSCTAACKPAQITEKIAGDKCCPPGADASTDSDCQPTCGDGVKSPGEKCDPKSREYACPDAVACEDHDPCTIDGVIGSAATCDAECLHTPIGGCRSGCGNGIRELDEECDHAADGEVFGVTCDVNCRKITEQVDCEQEEDCWEPAPGTICVDGHCVAVGF